MLEGSSRHGVEKFTLAGWELLQKFPPSDFRPPGRPGHVSFEKLSRMRPRNLTKIRYNAEHIVTNGPETLKACFDELVGAAKNLGPVSSPRLKGESRKGDFYCLTLLPKLLAVPHPVHLHAFIRVLGLHEDYDGILKFVQ